MNSALQRAVVIACLLAVGSADAATKTEEEVPTPQPVAISLGKFMIRDIRSTEGLKVRLSFALFAEVPAERAKSFGEFTRNREHRLRNEVITAIRTAEQSEFQQPGLDRFRRRVLLRLRRVEPTLPVERLLIGEFEYLNEL